MVVANRSLERGQALAGRFGGEAVSFDHRWDAMAESDIVITSTSSTSWVVTRCEAEALMRQRRGRPLFLIDLAVPRNVEPSVNTLENVYVYDIDDLQVTVEANLALRCSELERAWRLVEEEAVAFCAGWPVAGVGRAGLRGGRAVDGARGVPALPDTAADDVPASMAA